MASIVYVRAMEISNDGRIAKFMAAARGAGHTIAAIEWNRGNCPTPSREYECYSYTRAARYGAKWRNLMSFLQWWRFVFLSLWHRRKEIDIVHSVDLDTVIPALVFCRIVGKRIVFDVYDHYADSRNISGVVGGIMSYIERAAILMADIAILVDDKRKQQHRISHANDVIIIENVPERDACCPSIEVASNRAIRLGYFGVLSDKKRGIENLVQAAKMRGDVELIVAGLGPLSALCDEASRECSRISYLGRLDHQRGMEEMCRVDVVVGLYYANNINHRYAAPNKYYEHLMLGRPLLTSKGTPPGEKVVKYATGWAIDDDLTSILSWIDQLTLSDIEARGHRAGALWKERFSNYNDGAVRGTYLERIAQLSEASD